MNNHNRISRKRHHCPRLTCAPRRRRCHRELVFVANCACDTLRELLHDRRRRRRWFFALRHTAAFAYHRIRISVPVDDSAERTNNPLLHSQIKYVLIATPHQPTPLPPLATACDPECRTRRRRPRRPTSRSISSSSSRNAPSPRRLAPSTAPDPTSQPLRPPAAPPTCPPLPLSCRPRPNTRRRCVLLFQPQFGGMLNRYRVQIISTLFPLFMFTRTDDLSARSGRYWVSY